MKRSILLAYQSNKRLVERNRHKMAEESLKDIPVVSGKVKSSASDFPYIETHVAVQMEEPTEADKSIKRMKRWKDEADQAEREIEEVDAFISGIVDARDREIMTYRFIDGMKSVDVANKIGYTKGRVSQIISKYLKD